MRHKHIWRATSDQKTFEIEQFKMVAKIGSDAKIENLVVMMQGFLAK